MKNSNYKLTIILTIIITAILISGFSVYATYTYMSQDINYTKSDGTKISVSQALDELYSASTAPTDRMNGILVLNNKSGEYEINCTFKPKYIMLTQEKSDGTVPLNYVLFWYNELVSTTKSYYFNKVSSDTLSLTMESNSSTPSGAAHIYGINSSGFKFYSPSNDGRKLYWSVFQ